MNVQEDSRTVDRDRPPIHVIGHSVSPRVLDDPSAPLLRTDRYGWQENSSISMDDPKITRHEDQAEAVREKKWLEMMSHWREYKRRFRKRVRDQIRSGIPDRVRSLAWKLILHSDDDLSRREPLTSIVERTGSRVYDIIDADIPRTFPDHIAFHNESTRGLLRTILRTYSNLDFELGYVQGMSFLAAMFVLYMDETTAFWCFEGLMKGQPHNHRVLYLHEFAGMKQLNIVWSLILRKKYPRVARNLETHQTEPIMYTAGWFLTAFMTIGFKSDLRLRIFDRFLEFGCRALISFGLVIVSKMKEVLTTQDTVPCLMVLQRPHENPIFQDWRKMMVAYDKKWISSNEYRYFFIEANVEFVY